MTKILRHRVEFYVNYGIRYEQCQGLYTTTYLHRIGNLVYNFVLLILGR